MIGWPLESIPVAIAGFVYGLTGDNNLDELEHCLQTTDTLA